MTHAIATQAASFALSAIVTLATLAGVDALAAHQYVAADALAMAQQAPAAKVAVQTVVIVGHRNASV